MRNVKYGLFQDHIVEYGFDWENMMIGQHVAIRRAEKEQYKTRGLEYYLKDENGITILKNVTLIEKSLAQINYFLNKNKNKVVAGRDHCNKEEVVSNEPLNKAIDNSNQKIDSIENEKKQLKILKRELEELQKIKKVDTLNNEEIHEKIR